MNFYFFDYNLKMKVAILLCVVILSKCNLVSLSSQCSQKQVPDPNNICISPDYIEGCITYKNPNECQTCGKQYSKINGKCSILDQYSTNAAPNVGCLQSGSDGLCTNCANGFFRVSGICQVGVKNCEQYSSDNSSCLKCTSEFSLILGQCKHNQLLGCLLQSEEHNCISCLKPFQLSNNHCTITGCKTYNDNGCVACECGYYLTPSRSCKKMEQGCLKYYRNVCVECIAHYKLKGGSCSIEGCTTYNGQLCSQCESQYELINGQCQFKNCLDWQDNSCKICKEGYNMVKGSCVQSEGKYVCSG